MAINRNQFSNVKRLTPIVDPWVTDTKKRLTRVTQGSVTQLIEEASRPTAKGGNMRVDTGFLRASGQISFNGMPTGPARGRERKPDEPPDAVLYPYEAQPAQLELAKLQLGQKIWFGWTANYARAREAKDAFLRLATQKWQQIVNGEVAKAKAASKRNNSK